MRSEAASRRLRLVLDVSAVSFDRGIGVAKKEISELTPRLAAAYATKTEKTLTRDLNAIRERGLLREAGGIWSPADEQIRRLQPERTDGPLWS